METLRVGGRRYSDPDVVALIRATGCLVDPRSSVLTQARKLNQLFREFEISGVAPFERLEYLASIVGLDLVQMTTDQRKSEPRDAVILLNGRINGKRGQIIYNPQRPTGRILFSIAHEIGHTFFPNTWGGARFREMCQSDSREANELERLCDLGASELLMPVEEFRQEVTQYSLRSIPQLVARFGASFESTAYRLASAHPGIAVAGLLKYRLRKEEQRFVDAQILQHSQGLLFSGGRKRKALAPRPKYRRQSFHVSESCPEECVVRWNKSFDEDSCVYRATQSTSVVMMHEALPNQTGLIGSLEVLRAPFQREDADPNHPDLLFLWVADETDCQRHN